MSPHPPRAASRAAERGLRRLAAGKLATTRTAYAMAGLAGTAAELDALVAANLRFTLDYYRRLPSLSSSRRRRALQATIEPLRPERLTAALALGRGAILTSVHLGDFDLAGSWFAQVLGAGFVVPVRRIPSPVRQRFYDRARRHCGFLLRRHGDVTLTSLAGELSEGRLVVTMLDRRPMGATIPVSFFGRAAAVSAAPLALARRTGAPIVPAATWGDAAGRRRLWFGAPRTVEAAGPSAAELAQPLVLELEWAIRQAPEQWHVPAQLSQLAWSTASPHVPSRPTRVAAMDWPQRVSR